MSEQIQTPFPEVAAFMRQAEWPVMSEVGQALIRTFADENADKHSIGLIISKDPALTANLLRMANSAMFGMSHQVSTLDQAISIVGISLIRTRALALCMGRMTNLPAGLDRITFWRYCMLCAGYAQWIASQCGVDPQQAWLVGMMLRLGEVTLGRIKPMAIVRIEAQPIEPGERWTRERQQTGFDEGQITAELAAHWDFPGMLVQGLRDAAQPLASANLFRLSAVLHLAARLADQGAITQSTLEALPLMVLVVLKLDLAALACAPPDADQLSDISMFIN